MRQFQSAPPHGAACPRSQRAGKRNRLVHPDGGMAARAHQPIPCGSTTDVCEVRPLHEDAPKNDIQAFEFTTHKCLAVPRAFFFLNL